MTQQSTFTAVLHGESGGGKSFLGDTVPAPRLILDAEGGSEFTPSWPKVIWDPNAYAPPGVQGCAPGQEQVQETTRVIVRDWQTLARIFMWIDSGHHHFTSLVLDSLTEIQKRCRDEIRGTDQMQQQHWGELLIQMETMVRTLRDLAMDPRNRLMNVVILALTDDKAGKYRPLIQGALQKSLPGFIHLVGYLYAEQDPGTQSIQRKMLIAPVGNYVAKDRTHIITRTFGPVIPIRDVDNPALGGYDLSSLVQVMDQRYAQPASAPAVASATPGGNA